MITWDGKDIVCNHEGCGEKINNHAWGKIKSGWFFDKTGKAFCPIHIPPWVEKWRTRRKRRK